MKCPHCRDSFHPAWSEVGLQNPQDGTYVARSLTCPACDGVVLELVRYEGGIERESTIVWPKSYTRPVAPEVEERFANDFKEASAVLATSPKASAALSRRCLQDVLREKAGVKAPNLDQEIQQVIDAGSTPSWLSENLDAVRVVGNFSAHPIKSTQSGAVVDVEPGEASFLLDVLDRVFDFYFVQPAKAHAQRDAINKKLTEAGKPPLKT